MSFIKTIFRKLFLTTRQRELMDDLKRVPGFKGVNEIDDSRLHSNMDNRFHLAKGEIQSILAPNLGRQKGLKLTKWYFKPGDIIKHGDVVCEISNDEILMEFESVFSGRIISICRLNQHLTPEIEIFKVEGI